MSANRRHRRLVDFMVDGRVAGVELSTLIQRSIAAGSSPIETIKAVREAMSMSLAEAKSAVHAQLPLEMRRGAEGLWDEAERALREDPRWRELDPDGGS